MKSASAVALAGLIATAAAGKDERTFAVLHFGPNNIMNQGCADPIAARGTTDTHHHTINGGSNFGLEMSADDLMQSNCTNARVAGDFTNYWMPSLFFQDPKTGVIEPVPPYYMNVYYFFEASNDKVVAFPKGLQMLSGDASKRTPPVTKGEENIVTNDKPISAVSWTCPGDTSVPAWPVDSDGTSSGIINSGDKRTGVGFPTSDCNTAFASPLRANVHFPECYDPSKGLDDYKNNMVFPTVGGQYGQYRNCPEGFIHVPHLFMELYWDTPKFSGRWEVDGKNQPFLLSNGDKTGYSLHADVFAAWDEDVLQTIIDTCNAGDIGMEKCPNLPLGLNPDTDCKGSVDLGGELSGPMDKLPGGYKITGFGDTVAAPAPDAPAPAPASSSAPVSDTPANNGGASSKPTVQPSYANGPAPVVVPSVIPDDSKSDVPVATSTKIPVDVKEGEKPVNAQPSLPVPAPAPAEESQCSTQETHTVWETSYVYATDAPAAGKDEEDKGMSRKAKRSSHDHLRRHRGMRS